MGGGFSKSRELTPDERRRKELEAFGVLIPPSFGVATPQLSPSALERLPREPSYLEHLHQRDPSFRLLNDYLQPGLWVTADAALGKARAALTLDASDTSDGTSSQGEGRLCGQRHATENLETEVQAGTNGPPSLSMSYRAFSGGSLFAKMDTKGKGWIGGFFDKSLPFTLAENPFTELRLADNSSKQENDFDTVDLKVGAWIPCEMTPRSTLKDWTAAVPTVNGFAAANVVGATIAMEARIPTDSLVPRTKSYFSMDLQQGADMGPPMQITLERSNDTEQNSAIALSQVFTFDRYQLNPVEDRAPRVRNTAGWTVRMEKTPHSTNVAVGGAWQLNRGLAIKAIVRPNEHELTTAILLKRWRQPRVACSIIHRYNWNTKKAGVLGVGFELETGRLLTSDLYRNSEVSGHIIDHDVPETKATLTKESFE